MIKKIKFGAIIGITTAILASPITVHAETPQERWIRIQRESNEEFMAGCEKDGNLTEEAEASLSWNKKATSRSKNNQKEKKTQTQENAGKGWVYSTDELHIVGLPEDSETGYTKSGWYGEITK